MPTGEKPSHVITEMSDSGIAPFRVTRKSHGGERLQDVKSNHIIFRCPSGRSTVNGILQNGDIDPAKEVGKRLLPASCRNIDFDDGFYHPGHLVLGKGGGDDPADGCRLAGAPANRDLVMLDAFLVDAKNTNIGGMLMSAGIDAARNIQAQRADLDASRGIFKPFEYPVRQRQGPGARKIAVIKTRTGDHVTDQALLGTAQARNCQTFMPPLISNLSQHHPGVPGM